MTVLSPSLPPVNWTTTRIVSFAPGFAASGAASAVRARNVGTVAPRPTRDDAFKKSRRFVMAAPFGLAQLVLGQGHHEVAQADDVVFGGVLGGPVRRDPLLARRGGVVDDFRPRLARD